VGTYSQATNPQRYAVLHEAADTLLDELTATYTVERRETKEPLVPGGDWVRTVRLIPRTPAAAPLAVAFTEFPSVVLLLGRWFEQSLPSCGCDACDENPGDLVTELRGQAYALVEGGLWERVRRRLTASWSESRLIGPDFTISQQAPLGPAAARAARRAGFAAAVQWAPWPRRPR
jgi:Family of unknown function (DUF6226)